MTSFFNAQRFVILIVVAFMFSALAAAQDASPVLTLEVTGFRTVNNGYSTSPRQHYPIGNTGYGITTGGASIPNNTVVNDATLTTPNGRNAVSCGTEDIP